MFYQILQELDKIFISSKIAGLFASFIAGFLASLSGCSYTMIPITLAVVGSTALNLKVKSFIISLIYVLGIATVYTFLGIISSIFGILFSNLFENPFIYFSLFIVFFILGLINLEIIPVNIFFSTSLPKNFKNNFFGIFLLGIISGFAYIPCNFPVLGSILLLISSRKSILYAALALFVFALGHSVIFLLLGTFVGLLKRLPRQGFWNIIVKKLMGIILIIVALYFLFRLWR